MCLRITYYLTQIRAQRRVFNQKGPAAVTSRGVIEMAYCSRSSIFRQRLCRCVSSHRCVCFLCSRASGSRILPNRKSERAHNDSAVYRQNASPKVMLLISKGCRFFCYFFHLPTITGRYIGLRCVRRCFVFHSRPATQ